MKSIVPLVILLTCSMTASASESDPATCHMFVSSDQTRLLCYDKATGFGKNSVSEIDTEDSEAETKTPLVVSKWVVETKISEIDDSTNVYMHLTSDDEIRGRFGSAGPMEMFIHCRENTTLFYIVFNSLFMSDHQYGRVTYRLDSQKAQTKKMKESTSNMALGLWRGRSSIPFVKSMFGHEKMLVRATPHGESAVTATFSITGLEEAVEPLRRSCHW